MKTLKMYLAGICALVVFASACNKETTDPVNPENPQEQGLNPVQPALIPGSTAPLSAIQTEDAGKATLSGTQFSWNAGDEVGCYQYFSNSCTAETHQLTTLSTTESGVSAIFTGDFPYTTPEDGTYMINLVYPRALVSDVLRSDVTADKECVEINFPDTQDGRLENVGDYFLTFSYRNECDVTVDEGVITHIEVPDAVFSKHAVIGVKVSVPEALGIKKINLTAYAGETARKLAGSGLHYNPHNQQFKNNKGPNKSTLKIQRSDDSDINGDTYACIMPYRVNNSSCDVTKLVFELIDADDRSFTFSKAVSSLQSGTIYDLGAVPTSCVTPSFSLDGDGKIVISSSPAEATIYYTTDGSDPTTSSTAYSEPFTCDPTAPGFETLRAIAVCDGLDNSGIGEIPRSAAPVLLVKPSGEISVNPVRGVSYQYSMTSDGTNPGDPDTDLDVNAGIDILSTGTGTYKLRVAATNVLGESYETLAQYRIFYQTSSISSTITVSANSVDMTHFAPFRVTNIHATQDLDIKKGDSGWTSYWKFSKTNGIAAQQNLWVGLETEYACKLSFHALVGKVAKKIYVRYDGVRGGTTEPQVAEDGVRVLQPANAQPSTWAAWWTIDDIVSAGKLVDTSISNDGHIRGWAVLEQGFGAFNVAAQNPQSGDSISY